MGVLLGVDMNMPTDEEKIVEITEEDEAKLSRPGKAELMDLTDLESTPVEDIVTGDPYDNIQKDEIAKGMVIEELGDDEDETMPTVYQDDELAKGVVIEELPDDEDNAMPTVTPSQAHGSGPKVAPSAQDTTQKTPDTENPTTSEKSTGKRVLHMEPPPPEIQKEVD